MESSTSTFTPSITQLITFVPLALSVGYLVVEHAQEHNITNNLERVDALLQEMGKQYQSLVAQGGQNGLHLDTAEVIGAGDVATLPEIRAAIRR